jgi:hypothetical protein
VRGKEGKQCIVSIEETMDTEGKGKWFVLVDGDDNMETVRNYMDSHLVTHHSHTLAYEDGKNTFSEPPRRGNYQPRVQGFEAAFELMDLPEIITTDSKPMANRQAKRVRRSDYVVFDTSSTELYPTKNQARTQQKNWAQVASLPKKAQSKSDESTTTTATNTELGSHGGTATAPSYSQVVDTLTVDGASQQLQSIQEDFEKKLVEQDAKHKNEMYQERTKRDEQMKQAKERRDEQMRAEKEERDALMQDFETRFQQTTQDLSRQITMLSAMLEEKQDKSNEANRIGIQLMIKAMMEKNDQARAESDTRHEERMMAIMTLKQNDADDQATITSASPPRKKTKAVDKTNNEYEAVITFPPPENQEKTKGNNALKPRSNEVMDVAKGT